MSRLSRSAATMLAACVGVASALAPSYGAAEIYGWVDSSGGVTYSNLRPPKDAKIVDVIHEETPQAQAAAQAAHDSEMARLSAKVRQLEQELQLSRVQSLPPPPPYPPPAPPSYGAPPSYDSYDSYAPYGANVNGPGCDPEFLDCAVWPAPIYYSTAFVPYRPFYHREGFHHSEGFHHGDGFRHGFGRFPRAGGAPHSGSFLSGRGSSHGGSMARGR